MHHDLFSNFSYTALLQERGLITLSGPLSEALGSGIMFYATQLEETHIGPFIRQPAGFGLIFYFAGL